MKYQIWILIMGATAFAVASFVIFPSYTMNSMTTKSKEQSDLRVMSYNIHHANPPSQKDSIDIEAIVNTIKKQDPDLVALQEIDENTERSGPGNQAEIIAKKLKMNFFFGKAIDFDGGSYGVAILSKYSLQEEKVYKLPTNPGTGGEPRVLALAQVKLPNGKLLKFGSTHLDAQKENTNRVLQIKEIAEISSKEELPLIIAGDFNASPGSKVISLLDEELTRTCNNCEPTIPVNNPLRAIDFITYTPKQNFLMKDHKVIDETYASDHLPVMATLKINF